jgi:uncharacterized membrane protein YeaQ/YmgE (transglycosylase-associated protein family)
MGPDCNIFKALRKAPDQCYCDDTRIWAKQGWKRQSKHTFPGKPGKLEAHMGIIGTIIGGAVVGIIAKFIMPGSNEPKGFILTAILGIVGSLLASYGGQALGWYAEGQSAGWIASIIGAIIVLAVYGMATRPKA